MIPNYSRAWIADKLVQEEVATEEVEMKAMEVEDTVVDKVVVMVRLAKYLQCSG